jgi:hypothetical protein
MSPAAVLAIVNAPYSEQLDAQALAHCLMSATAAKGKPGHVSAFFGEIKPEHQFEFAQRFGITHEELIAAAKAFAAYSGEFYPLAT